jgi:VIT1/CCC1 family predicted Fe2+/Mn2+ transporter
VDRQPPQPARGETAQDAARYRDFWQDERESELLYRTFAEIERDPHLQQVYGRLADVEARHAGLWEERLEALEAAVPSFRPSWRTRTLVWLARRFSAGFVLPTLTDLESRDSRGYAAEPAAAGTSLAGEERSHARLLRTITRGTPGGMEGGALARLEGRHRAGSGNALRAAVLGASDGLLSNFSLVMGVAGADPVKGVVLLAGFAGLLAGAFSMALGEWISVQSSRELYERQIGIERAELEAQPGEEREELALIYQAKGLSREQAETVADRLLGDPATALDALVREELGIDPEELGGSAWEAAFASFGFFAVGAILPVLPFLFLSGLLAVGASVLLSVAGLFGIGAAITLQTGKSVARSGGRQVLVGLAAAAITFGLGRLLGVSLGG